MLKKLFILIAMALLVCSCATQKKIEYVDRVVVEKEVVEKHDTIKENVHDSIYHTIFQKGDTVYDTKYIEHTRWKEKIVYSIDTVYRDSTQTQIKETTVEKRVVPKWCYVTLIAWVVIIGFIIFKIYKWLHLV